MPRKRDTNNERAILEPITELQQRFIEALLTGKNISDAATMVGISRRAATYWLLPGTPIRLEYEKQRIAYKQEFYSRIANLHTLTLKALEDSLSSEAPPMVRFQAAKYLYEAHLQHFCNARIPAEASELVKDMLNEARFNSFQGGDQLYLTSIED